MFLNALMPKGRLKDCPMLRKITFTIAGMLGLAFAALAPVSSQPAPANGTFAPGVESGVFQAQYYGRCVCTRKASGRLVCGFVDRWGGIHESKACYGYGRGW